MPKRREQVADIRGPQPLQPQARPVDTYYRPPEEPVAPPPETNRLLQLAKSLRSIQPGINRFVNNQIAQIKEEEIAKGATAAFENRKAFNQAVKQGLIPAAASPWFRMGYERQLLGLIGNEYDSTLRNDFTASDALQTGDLNGFLQSHRENLFETIRQQGFRDGDIEDVLLPRIAQSEGNLTRHFAAERAKYLEEQFVENISAEADGLFEGVYKDSNTLKLEALDNVEAFRNKLGQWDQNLYAQWEEKQVTVWQKSLGQHLTAKMNAILETYPKPQMVNDAIVDYLEAKARTLDNPDILDVAQFIDIGNKRVLADIPRYQKQLDIARETIQNQSMRKLLDQNRVEDIRKENDADRLSEELLTRFKNNNPPGLTEFVQSLDGLGITQAKRLIEYYEVLQKATNSVPNTLETDAYIAQQELLAETGQADTGQIMADIRQGNIPREKGIDIAIKNRQARNDLAALPQGVKDLFKDLDDVFRLPGGSKVNELLRDKLTLQKRRAINTIKNGVRKYREQNPDATDADIEEQAQILFDDAVKRWQQSGLKATFEQRVKEAEPQEQGNIQSLPWLTGQSVLDSAFAQAKNSGFEKGPFAQLMKEQGIPPAKAGVLYQYLQNKLRGR